ncbi:unnamed protein product [Moneuplotes crassus]|uniref:Uncharacterized protein n=1 Tax=Euplotes crassus TaxID=5936 RepID=A0AAD1U2H3_EUPCR|nr:unnamed protein product [Moneuplotes crassus]
MLDDPYSYNTVDIEKKPINIQMNQGFAHNSEKKGRPRVLFQNIKTNGTSQNAISTIGETKLVSKSEERQGDIFMRTQEEDTRYQDSRDSYHSLQKSSSRSRRRVNFKRKGSINFSYSFLPGDIMNRKSQRKVEKAMKTLDAIMGDQTISSIDLKHQFLKEIIVKNVKIPKIQEKNNMVLLMKNLIDKTSEKISNARSDTIVHSSYKSHRLLQQMEEKEAKFKKLQRLKELSMKHNVLEKRGFNLSAHNKSIKINLKYNKGLVKSNKANVGQAGRSSQAQCQNTLREPINLSLTKKEPHINNTAFKQISIQDDSKKGAVDGGNLRANKFYKTVIGKVHDGKPLLYKDSNQTQLSKNNPDPHIDDDLKSANKIEIEKVERKNIKEYQNQNEYKSSKMLNTASDRFHTGKNSDNPSMATTPGKHMLPSLHQDLREGTQQEERKEEKESAMRRRKKQASKSTSYKKLHQSSLNDAKSSPNKLRPQQTVARNFKNGVYKNMAANAKNYRSMHLSKAKIFISGIKEKKSHDYIEAYKKSAMNGTFVDPGTLFRKSPSPMKTSPRKIRIKEKYRKNIGYQASNMTLPFDHDLSRKNLKLYLPQIDSQEIPNSRSNSDIRSRGRR